MQKKGLDPFVHPTSNSKRLDISKNLGKTNWNLFFHFFKEQLRSLAQIVERLLDGITASTTML